MSKTKTKTGAPVALNFFTLFLAIFNGGLEALLISLVEVKEALKVAEEAAQDKGKAINKMAARQALAKKALEADLKVQDFPSDEDLAAAAAELLAAEQEVKTQEAALVAAQESIKEAFAPFDAAFAALGLQSQGFWKGARTLRLVATSAEEAASLHKALREAGVEVRDLRGGVELTFTIKL